MTRTAPDPEWEPLRALDPLRDANAAALLAPAHREDLFSSIVARDRTPRRRRLWAAIGAFSTALTAGTVTAVVLLSSGAPAAFAGWAPVPTTASGAALTTAIARCYKVPPGDSGLGQSVLTESRGRSTAAIHVIDGGVYMCLYDSAFSAASTSSLGALRTAPGADRLSVPYAMSGSGSSGRLPPRLFKELQHRPPTLAEFPGLVRFREGDGYGYWVLGQAGRDVSAVRFTFAHRGPVTATVQNGWYFAWWPWTSDPISVTVTTGSGTVSSPMKNAFPGRVGSRPYPACRPGGSGCVFVKTRAAPTTRSSAKPAATTPASGTTTATTAPAAAAVATATQDCTVSALAGGAGNSISANAFTGSPVLTEVHGIYTAVINVTNGRVYGCLVGGDRKDIHGFYAQAVGTFGRVRPTPGPAQLSAPYTEQSGIGEGRGFPRPQRNETPAQMEARRERLSGGGYGPYALGQAGSDVSAVTFAFANHKTVAAIVRNGWYFAWWSWTSDPTSVTVRTNSGSITSPLARSHIARVSVTPGCQPGANGCVFVNTPHAASRTFEK